MLPTFRTAFTDPAGDVHVGKLLQSCTRSQDDRGGARQPEGVQVTLVSLGPDSFSRTL